MDIIHMGWRLRGSDVTLRLDVHVPTSVPPHLGRQRTPYYTLADSLFAHAEQVCCLPHSHPPGCQPVTPYVTPCVTPPALADILHASERPRKPLASILAPLRARGGPARPASLPDRRYRH